MEKTSLTHAFVAFLDLPESMPFGIPVDNDVLFQKPDMDEKNFESKNRELFKFIKLIETKFGEKTCYIGEDVIGEKFYKRFLFEKGGFVEIMTGVPIAISAHFTSLTRAKKFAKSMSDAIKITIKNPKIQDILTNSISAEVEEDDRLTFETWNKLRSIREGS